MNLIDAFLLRALVQGGAAEIVEAVAPALAAGISSAGIDTLLRAAHFLAQIAVESGHFTRLVEDLDYSAPRIAVVWPRLAARAAELAHNPVLLANAAYGVIGGNHGEATGDGWRYRGRGLIQITGRWNYIHFGALIAEDIEQEPDHAAEPAIAARLALAYWKSRDCNLDADRDDTAGVTGRINPAREALAEREQLKCRALALLTA